MMSEEEKTTITMCGVFIMDGHQEPIALFQFPEQAEEWARDNYFGNWLIRGIEIPRLTIWSGVTDEEIAAIEEEAKKLAAKFKELPEADD